MIPKVIHYCWFGGNPFLKEMKRCMGSWKKVCPDYEIIEWNESNFDIAVMPQYVQQAYAQKKWAFVSDYARLWIIYNYGGIYLDTDVKLIKPLDSFLEYKGYFGFEKNDYKRINTGLGFGAEKGLPILRDLMDDYDNRLFLDENGYFNGETNTLINWKVFQKHGVIGNDTFQIIDDNVAIFPGEYFDPLDDIVMKKLHITDNTHSIHYYTLSWEDSREELIRYAWREKYINPIKRKLAGLMGEKLYGKIKKMFRR